MRKGQNPAKMGLPAYQPKPIGLAVLTYIPTREGYFAQGLEILKYQLASLRQTAPEADLMVFDNGSCPDVQAELQTLLAGKWIDYLVLSNHNVGKTGALNWIFSAMPNELIGYADGDVLFRPGWLEASLQILEAFPEAGLVSAQPTPFEVLPGEGQASRILEGMAQYELTSRPLGPLVVEEYGRGIGLEAERIEEFKRKPVRMITNLKTGTQAVIGPTHMQFLLRQAVARQILPLPATRALFREETKKINERIDELGLVQLTTLEPYVYHLGNELDDAALKEIHERGLDGGREYISTLTIAKTAKTSSAKHRGLQLLANLSRWTFFRRTFQRLYNFLFEYYSQAK